MIDLELYEPGDWIHELEGYYFVCVFCNQGNVGRVNKKFCSEKCRYRHNNQRKRRQKRESSAFLEEIVHNRKVLEKLANKYGFKEWIPISEFNLLGFIWKAASKGVKLDEEEGEWYQYENLGIQIENKKVRIIKM